MTVGNAEIIDVLMISHNRTDYLKKSLPRLLDSADDRTRIWLWQNGSHEPTLEVWRSFLDHPRVYRHHHSIKNMKLREPTLWLWQNSNAWLVGKVDDDCIVDIDWIQKLSQAHADVPKLGVVASWHFMREDFDISLAKRKIVHLESGHQLLQNCWVGGSGYLVKRKTVLEAGMIQENLGFSQFCFRVAGLGYLNGWYYPLILQDHMDDPRSPNTAMTSDKAFASTLPLSALSKNYTEVDAWLTQIKENARLVQTATTNPKYYESLFWRSLGKVVKMFGFSV